MRIIASDGKDFKRPTLKKDEKGDIIRDENGKVIFEDIGFYSPIGATVYITDHRAFIDSFTKVWKDTLNKYGAKMNRRFCGAQYIVRRVFPNDFSKALSFLYSIFEGVEKNIDRIHYNWVILPEERTPMVKVGGFNSLEKPIDTSIFKRTIANVFPCLCAWSYQRHYENDFDLCLLDHFQGKTNNAWDELIDNCSRLKVIPKGDEVNPFICIADISAYLMDKKLYQKRLLLNRESVCNVFDKYSFDVSSFYFDERNLGNIKWRNEDQLITSDYYPSPMVWLLVDNVFLESEENIPDDGDTVKVKDFITHEGFTDLPLYLAQIKNGGAKSYHPDDRYNIRDGDYLIYMGPESEKTAKTFTYAYDLKVMSVKNLRFKLKEKRKEV